MQPGPLRIEALIGLPAEQLRTGGTCMDGSIQRTGSADDSGPKPSGVIGLGSMVYSTVIMHSGAFPDITLPTATAAKEDK
jgi:hypothetical protein